MIVWVHTFSLPSLHLVCTPKHGSWPDQLCAQVFTAAFPEGGPCSLAPAQELPELKDQKPPAPYVDQGRGGYGGGRGSYGWVLVLLPLHEASLWLLWATGPDSCVHIWRLGSVASMSPCDGQAVGEYCNSGTAFARMLCAWAAPDPEPPTPPPWSPVMLL